MQEHAQSEQMVYMQEHIKYSCMCVCVCVTGRKSLLIGTAAIVPEGALKKPSLLVEVAAVGGNLAWRWGESLVFDCKRAVNEAW